MERSPTERVAAYYPDAYRMQLAEFVAACREGRRARGGSAVDLESWPLNSHDFDRKMGKLASVPEEDRDLFLCFLTLEVLMDEVMYTHFKPEYPLFREKTMYPKVDFCGHGCITRDPWSILQYRKQQACNPLGISERDFAALMIVRFLSVQSRLFAELALPKAKWPAVRQTMMEDPDVCGGGMGQQLRDVLKLFSVP